MALQLPGEDEIAAIHTKIDSALTDGREPFADFDLGDYQLIGRLTVTSVERYSIFKAAVQRQLADAQWPATRIRRVSFRVFEQSGSNQRRDDEATERQQAELIELDVQRGTQGQKQRASAHAANNPMSVQEMLESKAPRIIALGVLTGFRAGRLWYDEFHLNHFTDWNGTDRDGLTAVSVLTETIEAEMIAWLQVIDPRLAHAPVSELRAAISIFTMRNRRNEPKQWLNTLVWDEIDRLSALFPRGFGAGDLPFTREAGRCWMVSMVARVMEPGCKVDTLPVFAGGEGIRKGQALEIIGGKYYRAATSKLGDKDFLQQLVGAIVFELPEMHSFAGRGRNTDEHKFIITNRIDNFRAPYERKPSDHLRTAVMAATTNSLRWFGDLGPGRRFDPLFCAGIDLDWLREHREQLWAQAVHHWRLGTDDPRGCWWNQPETERADRIELAREEMEFVEQIRLWLEQTEHYDGVNGVVATASRMVIDETTGNQRVIYGTLLETDRIAREALFLNQETMARNNNRQKIGKAMRILGFEDDRQRVKGTDRLRRFWTRSTGLEVEITLAEVVPEQQRARDGEIPF